MKQLKHPLALGAVGLVLAAVLLFIAAAQVKGPRIVLTDQETEWLRAHRDAIRYAPLPDAPPFDYIDAEGRHQGITSDYARLIEKKLGVRFTMLHYTTMDEVRRGWESGAIDLVGSLQRRPEREAYLRFTKPYYSVGNAILMRRGTDAPAGSLPELSTASIAIVEGSATHTYVSERYPYYHIVGVTNVAHGFELLSARNVDALITDRGVASFYIEQRGYPDIGITGNVPYTWHLCFASAVDQPLLGAILDKALDSITTYQRLRIHSRWMAGAEKEKLLTLLAGACILITLLATALFSLWNRILKRQVRRHSSQLGRIQHSHREATRALDASEERFRALVESSTDMIWEMDRYGNYTYVSPRVRDILGYDPATITGSSAFSYMTPQDASSALQRMRKAGADTAFDCEVTRHRHRTGRIVMLETSGMAFRDGEGRLAGFRGVSRDITERIEAEAAFRESEDRFRNLVETTSDWIWEVDPRGVFVYASPQASALLGYAPSELIGRHITFSMSERDAAATRSLFSRIADEGAPIHSLITVNRHRDGRTVVLETSAVPFHDTEWNIQGCRGISRDITERMAAEKQLAFERSLFRSFMDHVPDLVYFKDTDGRFIEVNAAKAEELHLPPEEVIGRTDFDFLPEEQAQQFYSDELEVMRTEQLIQKEELCTTPDGDRWYLTTKVPRYDEQGRIVGTFGTSWDITYRKQASEELRQLRAQLSNIIDSMPSILVGVDLEGRITQWNREAERVAEVPAASARGRPLKEVFPQLAREMVKVERAIRESATQKEERIPSQEGSRTRYSDVTVYPLLDNDAEGAVIRVDDVTDRVRLEDSIRNIVEGVSAVGRQFFTSMVIQLAKTLDAHFTFISEPDPASGLMRTIAVAQGGRVADNFEYRLDDTPCRQLMEGESCIRKSGIRTEYPENRLFRSLQAESFIGIPLPDSEGRSQGCMVALFKNPLEQVDFAMDILQVFAGRTTAELERMRATREMMSLRNMLSNIIDSMPSILVGVGADGRIIQWNHEAERITGTAAQQAQGRPLQEVFPRLGSEMDRILEAIGNRELRHDERIPCSIGGEARYADVTVYPLSSNGTEGAVIRVDDVTDRVRIEEMMVQSEKMMSVGGLAAGMAHEINNPLAGILQNLQVMRNRVMNATDRNLQAADAAGTSLEALQAYMHDRGITLMMDSVTEAARRAARIVDNMLSFSRKDEAHYAANDLREILERSVELASNDYNLKKRFDFRHIIIERDYDESLGPIPCEAGQIQQVILNLLSNSAQAMAEHPDTSRTPTITLRLRREPEMALIEVEDNGPGMDEETRKRAFEPFFTTKEVGRGTGLGLSVSFFIVTENHGGTMRVRSTPGTGTCFSIRIPFERRQEMWGLRL